MSRSGGQVGAAATCAALSAGVVASLAASQSVMAQDVQLDTINVEGPGGAGAASTSYLPAAGFSSPKQTATILNTPQTVTVIPQAVIREQGARNLTEVLRNTPGISFDAGENGFATSTTNFKLRGFDSSGNVFIDGARDSGTYTRDVFNIERVEVVKGGASDNGRGGAGGYINMVTKTPTLRNFIAGEFGYGFDQYNSRSRKRGTIDMNAIIGSNTAIRFNGLVEDSGVPGRDIAEMKPMGLAPSIAFGLGTDFRAIFAYEHVRRRDLPDWGVPAVTIPGIFRYNPATMGAPRDAFYGLRSDVDNVDSNSALARFEYDFSKTVKFTNQTKWSQVDRFSRFTTVYPSTATYNPVTQAIPTATMFYDRRNTSITNLTNLSAEVFTGNFKHNISAGLDVTREESTANRFANGPTNNTNLFLPNPDRMGPVIPVLTSRNDVAIDTVAAYIYDTLELNRQWQLTGGVRVENYRVNIGSKTATGASSGNFDGFSDNRTTWSGKFGVIYKPVPYASIYAMWSTSANPSGSYLSNPDISRTDDNAFPGLVPGADPLRIHNYEIGTKWELLNGQLLATAALFRTEKTNAPITDGTGRLRGYGQQRVEGIELSVAGKVTEAWQIIGGVAFMRSERTHSAELDAIRRAANPADYGTALRTSGNSLAFTPDVTANLWTTYRFPIGLTVGGGIQYVGETWAGRPDDANRIVANGVFGKLPAYTVVNAMMAYEIRKDVELRFNIDNIADTRYAVSMNWPATRAMLGPSRSYRISTSFRF